MSACRSCGAPVRWVETERGKRMPLDVEPFQGYDPRGLFVLRGGVAVAIAPDAFVGEPHYRSHFATCPHADRWRHDEPKEHR